MKVLDERLQQGFMMAMFMTKADFTNAFRSLADVSPTQQDDDFPESFQEVSLLPCSRPAHAYVCFLAMAPSQ